MTDDIDTGALAIARGRVTFVPVTNPLAYAKGERSGERNLNRNLGPVENPADFEDRVANWLCPLLGQHQVLLDLHSTRADAGPFAMPGPRDNDGPSEPIALGEGARSARVLRGDEERDFWGVTRRARDHLRGFDATCHSAIRRRQAIIPVRRCCRAQSAPYLC